MDISIIKSATTIAFMVIIGIYALVSLLTAYVFIRYGRSFGLTVITTLVFVGVFFLGTLTAFLTLQTIF